MRCDIQTFLPYASFKKSAEALDYRRPGKQRVEAYQILRTLSGAKKGWENHPAVKMWRGYEGALTAYYNCCVLEWKKRGYKNTMMRCVLRPEDIVLPPWFGGKIHYSHRQALLYKAAQKLQLKHNSDEWHWYLAQGWESDGRYRESLESGASFPGYYWPVR